MGRVTGRLARGVAALAAVVAVVATVSPATAARDPQAERDRVKRQQAAVAQQLNVLRANDAQVNKALGAIDAQVSHESAALAGARADLAAAQAAVAEASAKEKATATKMQELQSSMRDAAIQEYITGGTQSDLATLLTTKEVDLGSLASARVLREQVTDVAADIADQLEAAREDHEQARHAAEAAAASADAKRVAASDRLSQLQQARSQQSKFASEIDRRIEARLAEAANLETVDRNLAAEIVRQQQELARRAASIRRSTVSPGPVAGNIRLVTVRGITVAASIGDQLRGLLDAADSAGFTLGGGGYRSSASQQQLREAHCPNPQTSPPSSCHPPTARPGSSMHERGLAIDFTSNGHIISSRRDSAYQWLARNASRFGFYNLPSEPWHWSVNGD
jgi:hypothetical protein